jgi:DNA-binding NarL/FixJ family response regulator
LVVGHWSFVTIYIRKEQKIDMADVKRILVVDDHFEMLEFLRSMLELSNQEYKVLGVPSGEEGFLEMRRTPFDLLITDLRLPGMSGFELIRKVKASYPDMPMIMITGYSSDQGKGEAQALGVFRYFQKPLDTDALLAAVQLALYGEPVVEAGDESLADEDISLPGEMSRRLEMLRSDTGARHIILTAQSGQILFQSGNGVEVEMTAVASVMAANLRGSFDLSNLLGSDQPFTIQYQAGQRIDLYSANVGQRYLLGLFFDAQSRRGRIGTVWVFAQRAIKDMLEIAGAPAPAETAAPVETVEQEPAPLEPPTVEEEPAPVEAPPAPEVATQVVEEPSVDTLEDLFAMDDEAIQALLKLEVTPPPDDVDLDAFWEEASESEDDREQDGLSLEEAMSQGLVAFDEKDE